MYDEGFTYVVHVDIKSDRALIDGIAAYLGAHKGAHLIPSVRYKCCIDARRMIEGGGSLW